MLAVEYMKGQSWSDKDWAEKIICATEGCVGFDIPIGISIFEFFPCLKIFPLGKISLVTIPAYIFAASDHNANIYVFITGPSNPNDLGLAWVGSVCNQRRYWRTSITQYHTETWNWPHDTLAEDEATAETLTHEIGHNLGLKHDFQEDSNGNPVQVNLKKIPRQVNGVDCTGYMDYT